MSLEKGIHIRELHNFFNHIFEYDVSVYEAYSDFDSDLKHFSSLNEIKDYVTYRLQKTKDHHKDINLSLHYRDSCGQVFIEKHELNADKCNGAKYRYTSDGWGIINFNVFIEGDYFCLFCLNCRSEKEAKKWEDTLPEFGNPSSWDWKKVNFHIKRLTKSYKNIHKKLVVKL
ncbi:MAG: hypothetical protein HRU18_19800 [Pseudoalteromonas sp.]|uniref:hypothetical protein n=1 Tax=Pseudoalteromonas sp. TaxID=53249 RepID=UPI001D798AC8|nr:hypothetical protein [Pseudoalteromonas sp.]NRA80452.1 hypothetical protein [Pseudoalteromonas sp.]